jgi:hypothetical protein
MGLWLPQCTTGSNSPPPSALAGLGIRELTAAADIAPRTLHRLETGGMIYIAEKKRYGHIRREVWERIVTALRNAGVKLLPEGASFGSGARWTDPRARRAQESQT